MKSIKFSHIYTKLLDELGGLIESARLLLVLPVKLEDLPQAFVDYDTDTGAFSLPKKGDYLMLVFEKPGGSPHTQRNLFTTIRRRTPEKERYYRGLVGRDLAVEIVAEPTRPSAPGAGPGDGQ